MTMKKTILTAMAMALAMAGNIRAQVPEFVKCEDYYDINQRTEF